jgi:choline dehydrogenase-like flavoprotein
MSEDPRRGVVDRNSLIHGIDNLYVTGASVFPTGGYTNPTLTVMALALRVARHCESFALS